MPLKCPICGCCESKLNVGLEEHANGCMDVEEDLLFCPVCSLNLTTFSPARRNNHTNSCLDEAAQPSQPFADDACRSNGSIMNWIECSMCRAAMAPFKTLKARTAHINACAKLKGIQLPELLKIVKSSGKPVITLDRFVQKKNPIQSHITNSQVSSSQKSLSFHACSDDSDDDFQDAIVHVKIHNNHIASSKKGDKQDDALKLALSLSASTKTVEDRQQTLLKNFGGCLANNNTSNGLSSRRKGKVFLIPTRLLVGDEFRSIIDQRMAELVSASCSQLKTCTDSQNTLIPVVRLMRQDGTHETHLDGKSLWKLAQE